MVTEAKAPEPAATLVALEVENVKRLKVVRIRPDGAPLVVVGGDNDQGKSSLLDSIEMLIKGGRMPAAALREGETDGRIYGELSNGLVLERRFYPGGTSLTVRRGKRGKPLPGPQGVLDELLDLLAFDPLEFLSKKGHEQTDIMKRALGLDFTAQEQEAERVYEERKQVNHKIKTLKGAIEEAVRYPEAPAAEVSIAELTEQLTEAHEGNAERTRLAQAVLDTTRERDAAKARIAELESQLVAARAVLEVKTQLVSDAEQAVAEAEAWVDTAPIEQQLKDASEVNRKVRANQEVAAQEFDLVDLEDKTAELTQRLEDIETEKRALLAAAKFPVEGLGFGPDGPTMDGLPLEQAATSRKLRVVTAVAFRLKPTIKVLLIRRGSELNSKNLQLLAQLAEAEGGQVWVERVSEDGKGCDVVLEDGMLQGAPAPVAAE